MNPEIKYAKEFLSKNSKKHFFFQTFNFGRFKKFNEEYQKQFDIYQQYREKESEKLFNIISFKFFKKEFKQEGTHYIFDVNGSKHRYGILEILDYGIKQRAFLMKEDHELYTICERDYLNSSIKKQYNPSAKRRL